MKITVSDKAVEFRREYETVRIEAWGSGIRVRATLKSEFSQAYKALDCIESADFETGEDENGAFVRVGELTCRIDANGLIEFKRGGESVLREYYRDWLGSNPHSPCQRVYGRMYKPLRGCDEYKITVRFESRDGEKIFGMGQYQQANLDLKGSVLELAQRNSQASVPFYLSSLGYGFLWNNPCVGEAVFGTNYTQWVGEVSDEIDYWVTAGSTPKDIMYNFTAVAGRAPEFPYDALGLWQCKLRYRTQEELLEVAREYKKRGIPLDVIMVDFFHWVRQGDWDFDYKYWPDPEAMVKELKEMNTRCMVSVWPTVDRKSVNYAEMRDKGMLVRTEGGSLQSFDFQGDTCVYDATNPEARDFIWQKVKKSYFDKGADIYWLDESEPEYTRYDYEQFRYYAGPALKVTNMFPREHVKGFFESQKATGQKNIVNLTRCAWVGSQKYGVVVWSGDIRATFECLRDQLAAGLNMGIAGIPWWNSDTGGFFGETTDSHFNELMIRWFQFAAFCPILRMHGDRGPHDIEPLTPELDYGGGFCFTGRPNELWSFGEEPYEIMKKYLGIRLGMRDYIKSVMDEASANGSPVIRPMFYEFPDDAKCWEINDQYMFGGKYLVAPVMYEGMRERDVYLPAGKWKSIHGGAVISGGKTVKAAAPLDVMPVYEKIKN